MDVIEAMSDVGGDLHPRGPCDEISVARVPTVTETVGGAGVRDKFVNEKDDVVGDGGTEELDEAAVVTPADDGEVAAKLREVNLLAKVAARNKHHGGRLGNTRTKRGVTKNDVHEFRGQVCHLSLNQRKSPMESEMRKRASSRKSSQFFALKSTQRNNFLS